MRAVLRNCLSRTGAVGVVIVTAALWLPPAHAQHKCTPAVARLVSIEGNVRVLNAEGRAVDDVAPNAELCARYVVEVSERSRAALLLLSNETTLRLDQKSSLTLRGVDPADKDATWAMRLNRGAVHVITRTRPRSFNIETPFINASVDGTEFTVTVSDNEATVALQEGRVCVSNSAGSARIDGATRTVASYDDAACSAGEKATVAAMAVSGRAGQAPIARGEITVEPKDHVKWALYYPAVFDYTSVQEDLASLARPETTPERVSDPQLLMRYAGALLSVGRLDDAERFIDRALAIDANNAGAHALRSVIAVVRNEKQKALDEATTATQADPTSPAAWIALSYAQQASFQIEQAVRTMEAARSKVSPSALFLARLAELYMSVGEIDKSRAAAEEARARNPNLAKIQTVSGFAYLISVDNAKAKEAFSEAITLDQSDPLPRLGLGLAKIREGDLSGGREELEIAAVLDPANSLIRSYLGKAYYEEKRDDLAGRQFQLAKEFDRNDPTALLYEALNLQAANSPIQAFSSLQQALERNDARAVTRSRLLLDQDKATVNAGLAAIYNSLSFQQLALSTAYRELSIDPTNASLHTFLAETYLASPMFDAARSSEALQMKLYAPVTNLPSDPLIGESRLFLLKVPAVRGFFQSDIARLMDRPRVGFEAQGFVGGLGTSGEKATFLGNGGFIAGSIAAVNFRSDGFRPDEPFKETSVDVFVNSRLGADGTLQAEWLRSTVDRGELISAFDPDSILGLQVRERTDRLRVGYKHSFGPASTLLVSATSEQANFKQSGLGLTFEDTDTRTKAIESQLTLPTGLGPVMFGAGTSNGDAVSHQTDLAFEETRATRSQTNVYVYAYPRFDNDRVLMTLGASWDRSRLGDQEIRGVNPKLGVLWRPVPDAVFHAAVLKSFQRQVTASDTIEPTQVSGVNQLLFAVQQTKWRHYGVGADFKVPTKPEIFAGFDFTRRHGEYPNGEDVRNFRTTSFRAYGNSVLTRSTALAVEFYHEEYSEPNDVGDALFGRTLLRTQRVPLTFTWTAVPGGVVQLRSSYVHQTGILQAFFGNEFRPQRRFWLADLDLMYRFPNRSVTAQLVVRNLFGKEFQFEEPDVRNPILAPSRLVLFSIKFEI